MLIQKTSKLNPVYWFLSGILLYAAWPMSSFTFWVFFAWEPLLWVEEKISKPYLFFLLLFGNFLIWNAATTWWIWNASVGGAIGAILANSLLMCFPWMAYRFTKKKLGQNLALAALVAYWLAFEHLHHNWELSWPWLTLGNIFSTHPTWVQWYKYTGTAGGSFWVMAVNVLVFKYTLVGRSGIVKRGIYKWPLSILLVVMIFVPGFISSFLIPNKDDLPKINENVVVVQPNIDPYTEKFSSDVAQQVEKIIALSETKIDSNTRLLLWPETAVPAQVWEDQILINKYFQPILSFVKKYPSILLLTGIDSYKNFGQNKPEGFAARQDKTNGTWYEAYNTAMGIDARLQPQLYHKAKLVPGVETLPSWLSFMSKIFDDFGGTSGTLGRSKEPLVFSSPGNPYHAAPIICYESIYGSYVANYVGKGANVLAVITNDGWWGNTPGYRQHQSISRLRAIETGCWVARSANTGISCFIDPQGNDFLSQPWDTAAAIRMEVPVQNQQTFFVKHGDWLGHLAAWLAGIFLLMALFFGGKIAGLNL